MVDWNDAVIFLRQGIRPLFDEFEELFKGLAKVVEEFHGVPVGKLTNFLLKGIEMVEGWC